MCTPASYQQQRTRLGKAKYFDGPIYTFFFSCKAGQKPQAKRGGSHRSPHTYRLEAK